MNPSLAPSKPLAPPKPLPEKGAELLPWRTKAASRHLLMSTVYSLGITTATGVILLLPLKNGHLTLIALVTHLTSGALAFLFFTPFLFTHLKDGRESLWNLLMPWRLLHRIYRGETLYHRLLGYGLTCSLLLVFASGLVIAAPSIAYLLGKPMTLLPYGGHAILLKIHRGVFVLLFLFLILHFPKRSLS
ncbi:MAG: hypothetical protein LBD68_05870 [Zoogloeaceae bacterium]|jgi:hypothetical protein|nr:hypothetical protein [Zoogloeaceae bacterium]